MDGMLPQKQPLKSRDSSHVSRNAYVRDRTAMPIDPSRFRQRPSTSADQSYENVDPSPVPYDQSYDVSYESAPEAPLEAVFEAPMQVQNEFQPRRRSKAKIAVVILMLLTIGGSGYGIYAYLQHKHHNAAVATANSGQTLGVTTQQADPPEVAQAKKDAATSTAQLSTDADMAAAINAAIAANPGLNIAVSVVPLSTGSPTNYGIDAVFDAVGTGSLVTAAAYYKQVESGSQTLDKQINGTAASEQLRAMIQDGNIDAWNAVQNVIGKPTVQSFAGSAGMATYTATNNRMKTQDLAAMLQQLYKGSLLSAGKDILLGYMQKANQTDFVVSAVPTGTTLKVYHKAGTQSDRTMDAAIIDNGTNPYALVVFTKGKNDADAPQRLDVIKKITTATVARYIGQSAGQVQ